MKKLLHIIASPRGEESRTLKVSEGFLEGFRERHPGWIVDELDLGKEELPSLGMKNLGGKYVLLGGKDLYGSLKESWMEILQHIERFKTADLFLISTPMWNYSVPYMLKQYIDVIVQPKYLFKYSKEGPEGLVKGKKMYVVTTSGGQYSGDLEKFDFVEPYLRTIFGLVGIVDMEFIKAASMDMGPDFMKRVDAAKEQAREAGRNA